MGKPRNITRSRKKPSESKGSRQGAERTGSRRKNSARKVEQTSYFPTAGDYPKMVVAGILVLAAIAWSYWPTIGVFVSAWESDPDYSHGYLVVPLALLFLWVRRADFPGFSSQLRWFGLVLIGCSIGMRVLAGKYFNDALDGWSLVPLFGGGVLLIGGWSLLRWSLPSIVFLGFMTPLPYRLEKTLSLPLQRIATEFSTWTLQFLCQPALAEGNTILLGEHTLEVEDACSGLRIFVGIFALAFAYVVLVRRPVWQKGILVAAVLPIAVVANVARIVATGLLSEHASAEFARKFVHDVAGWVMIPFAALLFALVLFYFDRLFQEVEHADIGQAVQIRN